jgi:hypothetical protein
MTLEFVPAPEATPTINVCLIGPPKVGKSTGAASAPGPVLYVNCDLPTAIRFARQKYPKGVGEVKFEGMETIADVTHEVYRSEKVRFHTVVVDPVGECYRILLDEISKGSVRPSLPQYQAVSFHLERFCRALCEAPINAVFVCHDHPVRDEGSDEILQLPWTGSTNPKLGRQLMGMVDVVGFAGVIETEDGPRYAAQLVPGKGRPGGDRFNVLADPKTGGRDLDLTEWVETIKAAEVVAEAEQATNNDKPKEAQDDARLGERGAVGDKHGDAAASR